MPVFRVFPEFPGFWTSPRKIWVFFGSFVFKRKTRKFSFPVVWKSHKEINQMGFHIASLVHYNRHSIQYNKWFLYLPTTLFLPEFPCPVSRLKMARKTEHSVFWKYWIRKTRLVLADVLRVRKWKFSDFEVWNRSRILSITDYTVHVKSWDT